MENLNEKNRNKEGIKVGLAGLAINLLLSVFKVTIGIIANSQSIMADGINNFSDSMSSVITVVGFIVTGKPADREHPYGHQRFEYIAGFVMALIMGVLGLEVLKTSIANIIEPQTTTFSMLAIFVLIFSIAAKGFMAYMYDVQARKLKSDMLLASRQDSLNDMMTTAGVLIGVGFQFWTGYTIDAYLGLGLSLFILWSALKMVREFMNSLLGERPDASVLDEIKTILDTNSEILGYHDLMVHNYGSNTTYGSVHVEINQTMSLIDAHTIVDTLENTILNKTGISLAIHMDPLDIESPEMKEIYQIIKKHIRTFYGGVDFHDVRIIHDTLMFDLVIEPDKLNVVDTIKTTLKEELARNGFTYPLKVTVDTQQLI